MRWGVVKDLDHEMNTSAMVKHIVEKIPILESGELVPRSETISMRD